MYYLKTSIGTKSKRTLSFTSLPVRQKHYTLQKAPMAHKTNSKEHYKFKFFFFKITFKANMKMSNTISSFDEGLFFSLLLKPNFPTFSTNQLLLKSYKILFYIQATDFLTYRLN